MIKCGDGLPRCKKGFNCNKKRKQCEPKLLKRPNPIMPEQPIVVSNLTKCGTNLPRCKKGYNCHKTRKICEPKKNPIAIKLVIPPSPKEHSPSPKESSSSTRRKKANIITRFMKQTKHTRKARFLNSVCSNSGLCIAFGIYNNEIKKFFNGFSSFDYVESFEPIGVASNNGFVYSIKYKHRGYIANAVLKSSAKMSGGDNLLYEYIVGKQINKLYYERYPIFVETYDYYYTYKNFQLWNSFSLGTPITTNLKEVYNVHKEVDYALSCDKPRNLCILIQHIANSSTLDNMPIEFYDTELLNSLYQVYFTLSNISDEYTHYDLHTGNVLVYLPDSTKYIQYIFHHPYGHIIKFKSRYLIKIIDYGRNYIKEATDNVKENVCRIPECNPEPANCGREYGYNLDRRRSRNYIHTWKRNKSHDLRLLAIMKSVMIKQMRSSILGNPIIRQIYDVLSRVVFQFPAGTPEVDSGFPVEITNVEDAELELKQLLFRPDFIAKNEQYSAAYTKMGDLHIYTDKNMEYVPA